MSVVQDAYKCEDAWQKYDLSASFLADFVLRELVGKNSNEYNLTELFSTPAVAALLDFCVMSVNAYHRGVRVSSFGANAGPRPLEEGKKFEELLRRWADAGWIHFKQDSNTGEVTASAVLS